MITINFVNSNDKSTHSLSSELINDLIENVLPGKPWSFQEIVIKGSVPREEDVVAFVFNPEWENQDIPHISYYCDDDAIENRLVTELNL